MKRPRCLAFAFCIYTFAFYKFITACQLHMIASHMEYCLPYKYKYRVLLCFPCMTLIVGAPALFATWVTVVATLSRAIHLMTVLTHLTSLFHEIITH